MKGLLHRKVAERSIMKKLAVLLCSMVLGVSLIACGNDAEENQNPEPTPTAESSVGENDANVEDNNDATGGDNAGAATSSVTVADIKQAVVDELGENYWPNTEMPAEFLEGYGLTADMLWNMQSRAMKQLSSTARVRMNWLWKQSVRL